jgi:N-acetylneuraminic acid mutarotase
MQTVEEYKFSPNLVIYKNNTGTWGSKSLISIVNHVCGQIVNKSFRFLV